MIRVLVYLYKHKFRFKRIFHRLKYIPEYIIEALKWDCETCQRCGSIFRVMWTVDDYVWHKVTGCNDDGGGSYCVDCFIKLAENKNIYIDKKDIEIDLFYPQGCLIKNKLTRSSAIIKNNIREKDNNEMERHS